MILELNEHLPLYDDQSAYLDINRFMYMGEIVTDFMIRTQGYSLIYVSRSKTIITSQDDCYRKFEEYIKKGFLIKKRANLIFVYHQLNFKIIGNRIINGNMVSIIGPVYGSFDRLPVLPDKDYGTPLDELIEGSDGNYYKLLKRKDYFL